MIWARRFKNTPFKEKGRDYDGVDCYGPLFLVYRDILGIELPLYLDGYENTADKEEISALINGEKISWVPVKIPREFDVVVIRLRGQYMHVGVCTGDGRFLHCLTGSMVTIERLNSPVWKHRIEGFYRHASRS